MAYSNLICNYKTRLMPIIGYPMDHSNAAQVYNKLFEIYNINKIMFPIEIKPEDLGDYVKAAKTLHIDMYTLTMPLKSAIIPYLDEVDPCSRVFKSVNIVKTVDGKTVGAGMDGKGCVGALINAGAKIEGSKAVLLGAGSISGAIIYELIQHHVSKVVLLNRTPAHAEDVAKIMKDNWDMDVEAGAATPENLDKDITVLQMPLDKVYLTATSVMSLYDALDALDMIRLSGTQANGWYIDNAVSAMEAGDILFAGKYNEPDYELLISEDSNLAIESTMIFHSPKVKEMIEDLGIPVLVEYATYEQHPLGRVEWVKVYGVLTGKEQEAEDIFEQQKQIVDEMGNYPNTGKTMAYFYISSDGKVVVRDSSDYIPRMIEIAGGQYIYTDLINTESSLSSVSMTLEEFYNNAINADYLVYNATIDSPISSIDELLAKSELFADFKAVKEGNVWCNDKKMYQAVDQIGDAIRDFHLILTDGDESRMTFMKKVN